MEDSEEQFRKSLPESYRRAFDAALGFIRMQFDPDGIVVSGTIVRGNPDPASDLDIVVVHHQSWRQRVQRFFDGVPAELFVNPPEGIRRSYHQEAVAGRAVMAHMMATGTVIHDISGIMETLRAEARENLASGPQITGQDLVWRRYAIATTLEDATDIAERDPELARAMLVDAIIAAARLAFLQEGHWLPRAKALLDELDTLNPPLGH